MDAIAPVKKFYQALSTGNADLLDEALHPDWESIPSHAGVPRGRDAYKPAIAWLRSVLGEFTVTNHAFVEQDGLVAVRSTSSGVHIGELMGVAPTGRRVSFEAFDFHRVEDGLIVQTWHLEDFLALQQQMTATDTGDDTSPWR